jgi:hypothetical protein
MARLCLHILTRRGQRGREGLDLGAFTYGLASAYAEAFAVWLAVGLRIGVTLVVLLRRRGRDGARNRDMDVAHGTFVG